MLDITRLKQAARVVPDEQGRPVAQIPLSVWEEVLSLLGGSKDALRPEDRAWLDAANQSFDFWDNDQDAVYDSL